MPQPQFIRVYDGARGGQCKGCRKEIKWFTTLSGKHMPMDLNAEAQKVEHDPLMKRTILYFRASDSHWQTCPVRDQFKR